MEIKFKIHYSFYIFLFFIIYINGFSLFFSYFLALFIHELSHYLMARKYNILSQNMCIYAFGMALNVNNLSKNNTQNVLICLAGPLSNILTVLIITTVWWYFPLTYFYLKDFVYANIILGFFNLVPLYPLDGGNVILNLFSNVKYKNKVLKIMKKISIIFALIFLLLFIWSCFYVINFSCFGISFFLFSSLFTYKNIINQSLINRVDNCSIKENKIYIIKLNTKYEEIKKCFNENYFVQFYLIDDNNKIVKIYSQNELEKIYLKHLKTLNFNTDNN